MPFKLRFFTPILITTALLACSSGDPGGPDGGTGGEDSETGGASSDGSGGNGTGGAEGGAGNLPQSSEETIDEEGGTIETASADLDFPAGALGQGVEVTIASLDPAATAELPVTSGEIELAAAPVAFLPHGLTFDEPVAVSLTYDANVAGSVDLVVMKLDDEEDTTWEVVQGATFEGGRAHFSITSFSVYAVFKDPAGKAEELYSSPSDGTGGSGNGSGGAGNDTGGAGNAGSGSGGSVNGGSGGQDGSGGKGGSGGATGDMPQT